MVGGSGNENERQQPQLQHQNNTEIGAIDNSKVKLPDFTEEYTELWFWQVECAFESANIGADRKKYNTIIGQLPTRVMYKLADLKQNPPATGTMYNTLKQRVINEFGESTQTKITKLFSDMSLGDRKPSQLLAEMRAKAADTPVTEELLLSLWQRNLPEQVRAILSSDTTLTASQSATIADRIVESTRSTPKMHINEVQTTSTMHPVVSAQTMPPMQPMQPMQPMSTILPFQHIAQIQQMPSLQPLPIMPVATSSTNPIDRMQTQINQILYHLQKNHQSFSTSRNNNNQRSQTPARQSTANSNTSSSNEPQRFETCWWHFKFGKDARRCKEPCNFQHNSGN